MTTTQNQIIKVLALLWVTLGVNSSWAAKAPMGEDKLNSLRATSLSGC
jgi:hypothetical protein